MTTAERHVDVAVLGAGTAGLKALSEVAAATDNFVIIDPGPLGTLCARTGCMPSKVLLQIAADFHRRHLFAERGITGGNGLGIDVGQAFAAVRRLRDGFVASVLDGTIADCSDRLIKAPASFLEPQLLAVGDLRLRADRVVIATGSHPVVPEPWRRLSGRVLTTDTLFEQTSLPRRLGVLGLGPVGLEMGQALARLGLEIIGFDAGDSIGGLRDPVVNAAAIDIIGKEFPLHLGVEAKVEDDDPGLRVCAGEAEATVDAVLVAVGRRPNIDELNLAVLGVPLDDHGMPTFDRETMQVTGPTGRLPVFIAGDVDSDRPLLHEAGHEGTLAGFNAVRDDPTAFRRKSALAVTFTDPNLCSIGSSWPDVADADPVAAQARPDGGRLRIIGDECGMVRLYASRDTGRLLGAALALPAGEHIAHLLAWCHQAQLDVRTMARMPIYHPTVEEVLQSPLADLCQQLGATPDMDPDLPYRLTPTWPPPRLRR